MNSSYKTKVAELLIEFSQYLIENPDFAMRIPPEAQVVLLDQADPQFSVQAIESARIARQLDDLPDRPVIYVEVQQVEPIHSGAGRLKLLQRAPAYAPA